MSKHIIQGDLIALANKFDVIVHGCNCFNTMGAGIAKQIKEVFPSAYIVDQTTIKGDKSKLGKFSVAKIDGLYVINAYTQYNFTGIGMKADYGAIEKVFNSIKEQYSGLKIAYPKIGAGLAEGNWSIIQKIIDNILIYEEHTLVLFKNGSKG